MSSLKRWFLVLAVGIFVSALGGYSNDAQIVGVSIQNFTFQPSVLTVAVGTTVTWTNLDGATHTVTSRSGVWDSGDLSQNQKFSFTFTQPGEFNYFCAIHRSMKGKIIVMGQAKPSANFAAIFTRDQEVTVPAALLAGQTAGSGTGFLQLNAMGTELSFSLTYANLTGTATVIHFHRGKLGEEGPVVHLICGSGGDACPAGSSASLSGNWKSEGDQPLTADLVSALKAGEIYLNIHTDANQVGEVRAQITDASPSTQSASGNILQPSPPQPSPSKGEDGKPAPPSIGADIPLAYFGPAPSSVQKELVGPVQLLKAGTVDETAGTITLPLYQGQMKDGRKVWYILTDTTDKGNAEALGLNYSAKLTYAAVGRGARVATLEKDGTLTFDSGTVDFKPTREIVPGDAPNAFPPQVAKPGSIGDQDYSPLVRIQNAGNQIYNAPIIAFDVDAKQISFCNGNPDYSLVHDKGVKICPEEGTVTLELTNGFSFARPVLYLSTDSSDPGVAALEDVTYAPGLGDIGTGRDDSAFSAVERIFVTANGPTGKDNPQRQGLNSALTDGRGPLNVLGGIPTVATDYSPLWDVNWGEWTQEAINKGYRSRVTEEFQILGLVERGWITGPGGNPYGSIGVVVNCPIVLRFL